MMKTLRAFPQQATTYPQIQALLTQLNEPKQQLQQACVHCYAQKIGECTTEEELNDLPPIDCVSVDNQQDLGTQIHTKREQLRAAPALRIAQQQALLEPKRQQLMAALSALPEDRQARHVALRQLLAEVPPVGYSDIRQRVDDALQEFQAEEDLLASWKQQLNAVKSMDPQEAKANTLALRTALDSPLVRTSTVLTNQRRGIIAELNKLKL
jgi:hypothetical protein